MTPFLIQGDGNDQIFTGTPHGPTANLNVSTTQLATTEFVTKLNSQVVYDFNVNTETFNVTSGGIVQKMYIPVWGWIRPTSVYITSVPSLPSPFLFVLGTKSHLRFTFQGGSSAFWNENASDLISSIKYTVGDKEHIPTTININGPNNTIDVEIETLVHKNHEYTFVFKSPSGHSMVDHSVKATILQNQIFEMPGSTLEAISQSSLPPPFLLVKDEECIVSFEFDTPFWTNTTTDLVHSIVMVKNGIETENIAVKQIINKAIHLTLTILDPLVSQSIKFKLYTPGKGHTVTYNYTIVASQIYEFPQMTTTTRDIEYITVGESLTCTSTFTPASLGNLTLSATITNEDTSNVETITTQAKTNNNSEYTYSFPVSYDGKYTGTINMKLANTSFTKDNFWSVETFLTGTNIYTFPSQLVKVSGQTKMKVNKLYTEPFKIQIDGGDGVFTKETVNVIHGASWTQNGNTNTISNSNYSIDQGDMSMFIIEGNVIKPTTQSDIVFAVTTKAPDGALNAELAMTMSSNDLLPAWAYPTSLELQPIPTLTNGFLNDAPITMKIIGGDGLHNNDSIQYIRWEQSGHVAETTIATDTIVTDTSAMSITIPKNTITPGIANVDLVIKTMLQSHLLANHSQEYSTVIPYSSISEPLQTVFGPDVMLGVAADMPGCTIVNGKVTSVTPYTKLDTHQSHTQIQEIRQPGIATRNGYRYFTFNGTQFMKGGPNDSGAINDYDIDKIERVFTLMLVWRHNQEKPYESWGNFHGNVPHASSDGRGSSNTNWFENNNDIQRWHESDGTGAVCEVFELQSNSAPIFTDTSYYNVKNSHFFKENISFFVKGAPAVGIDWGWQNQLKRFGLDGDKPYAGARAMVGSIFEIRSYATRLNAESRLSIASEMRTKWKIQ